MKRFSAIFSLELRRQLRSPALLLSGAFLALVAFNDLSLTGATASGLIRIGRVPHNAPLIVAELLTALSVPGLFLLAVVVGPTVQRDFAHRSYPFYFTTPVSKLSYLGGRFAGAMVAALVLPVASFLGMAAAWGVIPPEFVGAYHAVGLLEAGLYSLPTLLLFGALFFTTATLSRAATPVYFMAVVAMIVVFMVQGISAELLVRGEVSGALRWALVLADPTGRAPLAAATSVWSAAQRDTPLLPLGGAVLINRLLWAGGALALLGLSYGRFSLSEPPSAGAARREERGEEGRSVLGSLGPLPVAKPEWGWKTTLASFLRLTMTETKWMMRHLLFLVLLSVMVIQLFSNFVGNVEGAGILPLTGFFLNQGLVGIDAPMVMITLFFAGVLVWRERESGEHCIVDALPMSNLVHLGSKLVALWQLQAVYAVLVIGVGVFAQVVLFGYTEIEPALYVKAVLGIHLLGWWQIAAGMFFLQVLSPGKHWGFVLSATMLVWSAAAPAMGLTSPLFRFGATPAFVYSDMNGFGPFAEALVAYRTLWSAAALLLLGGAVLAWSRGVPSRPGPRVRALLGDVRRRATWFAVAAGVTVGLATWAMRVGGNLPGTGPDGLRLLAEYELRYKSLEAAPRPAVTAVDIEVDIFPHRRSADIRGSYRLVNRTDQPVEVVQLTLLPTYLGGVPEYSLDRPWALLSRDTLTGVVLMRPATPLPPGDSMALRFSVSASARGSDSGTLALVENGTVLDNFVGHATYFPLVGYRPELEVQDSDVRRRNGLSADARTLRSLSDPEAATRATRDWVRFSATVSTDTSQVPLTAGSLVEQWTEGGRRFARFRSDGIMANEFAVISGRYAVARDSSGSVALEVYHHPTHAMNLSRVIDGVKAGFEYSAASFGPYPYRTLRVVEVPGYGVVDGTAVSKPGILLWNETGGFVSAPPREGVVDPVFSTGAHESGHQWWGHQVRPAAFVEGALTLNETLAQYVRLMALRGRFNEDWVRDFLREEERAYFILRGRARTDERSLETTTDGYVAYHKGSLAMDGLLHHFGEDALNQSLRSMVTRFSLSGPPFATSRDLVTALRGVAPDSLGFLVEEWFESISLYDNRVVHASSVLGPDGRTELSVTVELRKLSADGRGNVREVPFEGMIEVGVLDSEGNLVQVEAFPVRGSQQTVQLVTAGGSAGVVLDPYLRLIESNRDDNAAAVVQG